MKSEQKYEEMVQILDELQEHVPKVATTEEVCVPGCNDPVQVKKHDFYPIALGN